MSDREEREEHIKRLEAALACEEKRTSGKCSEQTCDDNCALLYEQGNLGEWKETLRYAINSLKTDLKYDLLYEETTTENCIACKYDEIEESDGSHCKKCLAGDNQFELDKEFIQPTIKNDAHDINVGRIEPTTKNDLSSGLKNGSPIIDWNNCHTSEQLDSISTTKNDLAVDCISRADAIGSIAVECSAEKLDIDYAKFLMLRRAIKALPTVTPISKDCTDCIAEDKE